MSMRARNVVFLALWLVLVGAISVTAQQVQTVSRQVCTLADTVTTSAIEMVGASDMSEEDIEFTIADLYGDFAAACPNYRDPGS